MKPLKNNVVLEYLHAKKETASGIILKTSEEPAKGRVKSIGPDVTEVSIGQLVCVDWNHATKIQEDEYVVSVNHIVFVYEESD